MREAPQTMRASSTIPSRLASAGLLLVHVALTARFATADIIFLKNGNQLQGEVVTEAEDQITVSIPGGTLRIPRREVLRVENETRLAYLLAEGEKHAGRRDFTGALEFFRLALEEEPDSHAARRSLQLTQERLAEHLAGENLLEQARDAYLGLLDLSPDHPTARQRIETIDSRIEEVDLEIQRADSLLGRGQLERGYARLKDVYESYPERRSDLNRPLGQAAIELGHRAFEEEDWEESEQRYLEALSFDPDLLPVVEPRYAYLKVEQLKPLVNEGKFETILGESEKALDMLPTNDFLHYFRAIGLEGVSRRREAAQIYVKLSQREAPADPVASIDTLRREAAARLSNRQPEDLRTATKAIEKVLPGKWRKLTTEHFVVYHRNNEIGQRVAAVAELTYDRLFRAMGLSTHWYKPCDVFIHPTQEEFMASTDNHKWSGGAHFIAQRNGVLKSHRIESFQTQPRLLQAIIPHEVTHAMLAHYLRYRQTVPLWLNEGLAARSEPMAVHRYYQRIVRQALEVGVALRATDLTRAAVYPDGRSVQLFYAHCFSVCDYLIQLRGLKTFLRFSEQLTMAPDSLTLLLRRFYRIDGPTALQNRWLSHMEHQD